MYTNTWSIEWIYLNCFFSFSFSSLFSQNVAVGVLNKVKDFGKEAKDTIEDEVNKDVDKVAEMTHMKPW